MLKVVRRWSAKARGIPFSDERFWPPYYINRWGTIPGQKVMQKIYAAKPGEVVPIMHSETEVHFYKIISEGRAWGDDHVVSPRQWHIVYHHSEQRTDAQAAA